MSADATGSSAKSVLVTGASGLLGSQVVAMLAETPGSVTTIVALDLHEVPAERRLTGVTYETGDIRDSALGGLMAAHGVDTVVHLAAIVNAGKDSTREFEHSVDVGGTANMLECSLAAGVSQFIYASSGAAYGYHADNPAMLDEDDELRGNPEFAYSDHKRLVEEMLLGYRTDHPELTQLILRPGTILGERVNSPITAIFERPVVMGVRGTEIPFVLIWDTDVARCILDAIAHRRTGIYNVAGDGTITLREIARRLHKRYLPLPATMLKGMLAVTKALKLTAAGPEQVKFLAYRPVLSNERLKTEFGFTPSMSSEECFERYRALRFGP